jgi:O-antigen/teichoic acid export membrane protein
VHGLLARARGLRPRPTGNLLARFVALNMLGVFTTGVIGFFASIMLARLLGPSDRGLVALMYSVSSLALVLSGVGVPWATVYYAKRGDATPQGLFGNSLLQAAVMAAVLIPATWLGYQWLADTFGHGEGGTTWVLAAALVPVVFLDWTTHGQLQGMLMFGRYNLLSVLAKIAYLLTIVLLLGIFNLGVAAGICAYIVASLVMIGGALKPILAAKRPRIELQLLRRMLRYGSRVQVGSIFQVAMARTDIVILQFFRPLSQVGYYVVAQTIAELLLQLSGAFQMSVMPLVSRYEGDERQAMTSADSVRHYGIIGGGATLGNVFFGTAIILVAYGSQYHSAIVPMLVLLPGIWFLGMGGVIQGDLSGRGRPGLSSQLAGLAAVVTIVLDLVLIPPFGVIGAAIASVIAYTTYGVVSLMALRNLSGIPIRRLVRPTRADVIAYRRSALLVYQRLRQKPSDAA